MLACQKIEVLHYTDLGLEVRLLLWSDYGQGLLPEPSNISVRFSLSLSLLNMSLTMSLLTLYLTEHPAVLMIYFY